MSGPVIIERFYAASLEKVWKAITDKDKMRKWYFDLDEFRAEVGFEFSFSAGPDPEHQYVHLLKVTEVVPFERLGYSWDYENLPGSSHVLFELFEEGNGTRLKLTHTGVETFRTGDKNFARESFEAGWTDILGKFLHEFLEQKPD